MAVPALEFPGLPSSVARVLNPLCERTTANPGASSGADLVRRRYAADLTPDKPPAVWFTNGRGETGRGGGLTGIPMRGWVRETAGLLLEISITAVRAIVFATVVSAVPH